MNKRKSESKSIESTTVLENLENSGGKPDFKSFGLLAIPPCGTQTFGKLCYTVGGVAKSATPHLNRSEPCLVL